ncbi:hypothetical protein JCM11641_006945 [Rhodosporidiobolus odoratus]
MDYHHPNSSRASHGQPRPQSVHTQRTGVSRRSSVASRASQLKQKAAGPTELRPSDILIERFSAWKRLVKNLITYFEGIADIEANTAKELQRLGGVIQVPFREGNQFLGEGGVQDIFYGVRERTRLNADHHANLAKTVEGSIVQHLQKLRTELKAHIQNIRADTGKLAASVAKEREISTKMITDLARSITLTKNTPMGILAKDDPWYTNSLVARQLQKQVHEENALQKSIIIMQQNSEHFEEGVVRAIQMAWQTFDEWNSRASSQVQETWQAMGQLMRSVAPTTEWIAFASRSEYLLDPETPLRNPLTINYPGKDDPSVLPVHQGILERKKRYTKTYKESFYVLTPAGYLHEYPTSDLSKHPMPELSLFLPECTLGAPTTAHARSHKFHIEGKKSIGGDVGQKNGFFASNASYTFRARSHDEMLEWWNDCKQLSKVYLTASEPFDRSGPVPAAVRAAGYVTDEEDEFESDEEGSSVEEEESEYETEEEEEHGHRHHNHHNHHGHAHGPGLHHQEQERAAEPSTSQTYTPAQPNAPVHLAPAVGTSASTAPAATSDAPPYSVPAEGSGIQLASTGYAAEKKGPAAAASPAPAAPAGPPGAATSQAHDGQEEEEEGSGSDSDEPQEVEFHENKPGFLGRFVEALGGHSGSQAGGSVKGEDHHEEEKAVVAKE